MVDEMGGSERALLEALQADDSPSADEQARVKRRLFAQLGVAVGTGAALGAATNTSSAAGSGAAATLQVGAGTAAKAGAATSINSGALGTAALNAGAAGTASNGVALGTTLLGKLSLVKVGGIVAGAALIGGGVLQVLPDAPTSDGSATSATVPATPTVTRQVTEPSTAEETAEEAPDPEAVNSTNVSPEPRTADETKQGTPARRKTVRSKGPTEADTLKAEAELLSAARAAMHSGNPSSAIAHLREHERRFPTGTLRLERQATLAIARCEAGQTQRGRSEAERYRKAHPRSPMRQRLEQACGLTPLDD